MQSKGLSRVFSNTTVQKHQFLRHSDFFTVQLSHQYMTTGKTIALTRRTFVGKVMSLLLNMLSRLVITFLPRSKRLLISWLQSPSAVILEPKKIKSDINSIKHLSIHTYICMSTHLSKSYLKIQSTHLSSPHPSIHPITCPPIHYYPAIYTSNQTPFPCSSPKTKQKCLGTQREGLAQATDLAHGNPVHSGPYWEPPFSQHLPNLLACILGSLP